jgi:hypothetical protein
LLAASSKPFFFFGKDLGRNHFPLINQRPCGSDSLSFSAAFRSSSEKVWV